MEEASKLSIRQLKEALISRGVDISDCFEKQDLVVKYVRTKPTGKRDEKIGGLDCTIIETNLSHAQHKIGIICKHGYGADGANLVPLGEVICKSWEKEQKNTNLFWIFPNAPLLLDSTSFQMRQGGRAWFPLNIFQLLGTPPLQLAELTLEGLDACVQQIKSLIDYLVQLGFTRIILSGFSQGAIVAAHTAFSIETPNPIVGLGLFSGAVQARVSWTKAASGILLHCFAIRK